MARGGYTFEDIRKMSDVELLFLKHYQEVIKKEQEEFLVSSLGIVWDKKSFEDKMDKGDKPIEKLFIPLSVAVNPEVLDYVRKQFKLGKGGGKPPLIGGGDYIPKQGEEVVSMGDLSKEDFLRLIGRRSRL